MRNHIARRENTASPRGRRLAQIVFCVFLMTLTLPNIILSLTEHMSLAAASVNIILPMAVTALLLSLSSRLGRTIWLMLPLTVVAAFQIVLIGLYGRSLIAVDMFLNVASTNPGEAGELLANILPSVITVAVLYLPSLVLGMWMWIRKISPGALFGGMVKRAARIAALYGGVALVTVCCADRSYAVRDSLYPVNAFYNLGLAVHHTVQLAEADACPPDFTFDARSTHPDSISELYVLVIGETSRADHWQINGYGRSTTPRLSTRAGLRSYRHTMSESNTTHKSVPLLMSHLTASTYGDSIYSVNSVITAFREAGFHTAFLSSQKPNHSFIEFFGREADTTVYLPERPGSTDLDLLPALSGLLADKADKQLIVIHSYGSHFNYHDRYPRSMAKFLPDSYKGATAKERDKLVNAYDNTILMTDRLLDAVMSRLERAGADRAALIYTADHGEDLYDDHRELFLHASPCPSYYQLQVPFLVWISRATAQTDSILSAALDGNLTRRVVSSESFFDTALDIAGIRTPRTTLRSSLARSGYREPTERRFLDDHNDSRPLVGGVFTPADVKLMEMHDRD